MAREFIVKGEISRLILAVCVDAYVKRVCQDCMFAMRVVTTVQGASCITSCVKVCWVCVCFQVALTVFHATWRYGVLLCVCV